MGFYYSPRTVTDGLFLYLDAANSQSYVSGNTVWNNLIDVENNGTLINSPTYSDGAIVFDDASSQAVNCGIINVPFITIEVWVNGASSSDLNQIFSRDKSGTSDRQWQFRKNTNNTLKFLVFNEVGSFNSCDTTNVIFDNTWHHVVGTWDGANIKTYIDGNLENTEPLTGNNLRQTSDKNSFIGRSENTSPGYLNGKVAIAKLYNRALSDVEILQNYNTLKGRFGL